MDRIPIWENIEITKINRLPARTRLGAYESAENAKTCIYGSSSNMISLDGEYKFRLYPSPNKTDDFFSNDYDDSGFSVIKVPSNWELMGFDKPIYTNYANPWSLDTDENCSLQASKNGTKVPNYPYVPGDNPTGAYRKKIYIDKKFAGKKVVLRFEGVETVYFLWVNGKEVGYSEDSKLPSEFDITPYVTEGENLIALKVIRFAASTYIEDQDYWYLSGIFRHVWLYFKNTYSIEDYKITALPEKYSNGGTFSADVFVSKVKDFADGKVKVELFSPKGEKIGENMSGVNAHAGYRTDYSTTVACARVKVSLPWVQKWSTANPVLYRAVFTLYDDGGNEVDYEGSRFGFKLVEVIGGIVYINNERLVVRGVNRHEHEWRNGRAVTREHMIKEIAEMKKMNINSVRTCHYPDSPEWYELCDEYGILLVCECNAETHGVMGSLTHDPSWSGIFLERAVRMVQNYKNHVSIYSWSLGNESGTGANHAAMYGFVKEYDSTRLCQYEAGNPAKNISDVRGNMYATIESIMNMLCDPDDTRPIILVEYLYQIRNSGGGLEKFAELTGRYPRFQGAYVWDWQDKSLVGVTDEGKEYFACGGDFNERFIEPREPLFMTNNGVVMPDLTWKPVAYELKQAYCPVFISKPNYFNAWQSTSDWDSFMIQRLMSGGWSQDFVCTAYLREDGVIIAQKEVDLPELQIYPVEFRCGFDNEKKVGTVYTIEFSIKQAQCTAYADKGYEFGLYQFPLESAKGDYTPEDAKNAEFEFVNRDFSDIIKSGNLTVTYDTKTAVIQVEKNGRKYISGGFIPCLNRPLTGLDAKEGWGWYHEYEKVRTLEYKPLTDSSSIFCSSSYIRIEQGFIMSGGYPVTGKMIYEFKNEDEIIMHMDIDIDRSYRALPRVGVEFMIDEKIEDIEYFGFGPNENYIDRKLSAYLGVFKSTVEREHFAFSPPSETGGHEDSRYLMLTGENNDNIKIKAKKPFHFDVHRNTVEQYINAKHDHELLTSNKTIVHIDAAHAPIGGEMAWSTRMPSGLELIGGAYSLEFTVRFL